MDADSARQVFPANLGIQLINPNRKEGRHLTESRSFGLMILRFIGTLATARVEGILNS